MILDCLQGIYNHLELDGLNRRSSQRLIIQVLKVSGTRKFSKGRRIFFVLKELLWFELCFLALLNNALLHSLTSFCSEGDRGCLSSSWPWGLYLDGQNAHRRKYILLRHQSSLESGCVQSGFAGVLKCSLEVGSLSTKKSVPNNRFVRKCCEEFHRALFREQGDTWNF